MWCLRMLALHSGHVFTQQSTARQVRMRGRAAAGAEWRGAVADEPWCPGRLQNQEDSEWQRKQEAWKAQEEAWKAEQDRRAGEEASWKDLQEARHAEMEARKMSEGARREMELKWKAAQEAWKVRAACRGVT